MYVWETSLALAASSSLVDSVGVLVAVVAEPHDGSVAVGLHVVGCQVSVAERMPRGREWREGSSEGATCPVRAVTPR